MAQIDFLGDPIFTQIDGNGVPLAGALLWCYDAETDNPRVMYATINDAINQINSIGSKITLNSAGSASIVYAGPSKFILEGADIDPDTGHGPLIWTADNIGRFGNTVIDPNGNIIVEYNYQASAENYVQISNAPAGQDPIISVAGSDDDIGLTIQVKGVNKGLTVIGDDYQYTFPLTPGGTGDVITSNGDNTSDWLPVPGLSAIIPAGIIWDFGGTVAPTGFLMCDGAAVSRSTYSDLFAAIGTNWGVGDGVNTFNLPDFRRRARIGSGGTGTGTIGNAVGNVGGAESVALVAANNGPHTHTASTSSSGSHSHTIPYTFVNGGGAGGIVTPVAGSTSTSTAGAHTHPVTVNSQGSGTAHNNIQPSGVCLAIIKT